MSDYSDEGLENQVSKSDTPKTPTLDSIKNNKYLQGLKYFIIGVCLSIGAFEVAYWVVSNFGAPYIVTSVTALLFSVLVIWSIDKVLLEQPSPARGPVVSFTIIIFILSLFIGYNVSHGISTNNFYRILWGADKIAYVEPLKNEADKSAPNPKKGIINHFGEVWRTAKIYNVGDNVRVRISGSSVRVKDKDENGDLLRPGDYFIPITARGNLAFVGIKNRTSTIEVLD